MNFVEQDCTLPDELHRSHHVMYLFFPEHVSIHIIYPTVNFIQLSSTVLANIVRTQFLYIVGQKTIFLIEKASEITFKCERTPCYEKNLHEFILRLPYQDAFPHIFGQQISTAS